MNREIAAVERLSDLFQLMWRGELGQGETREGWKARWPV
jgi:hypothetical protein